MKMKIISDNAEFERQLMEELEKALEKKLEFENLILVDVNAVQDPSQKRTDMAGIKIAAELAKEVTNIVILFSLIPERKLKRMSDDFVGIMTLPNVGYVDALEFKILPDKYQVLSSGQKKTDTTGLAVYKFNEKGKKVSRLKHDLSYITRDSESREKWFSEARAIGLAGTEEEIITAVKTWRPETAGEFNGVSLEGLFVDAFETLFDENWNLFPGVEKAVKDIAESRKAKIFVISDSNTSLVKDKLEFNRINWPVMSKYDLRGATLEYVIDNLTREEFEDTYKIKTGVFMRASCI